MKKPAPAVRPASVRVSPSGAAPGRQELRRNATRRELIAAGRRLFGSEGIFESRIEDITEHAGIAKGTLYLHFESKEDLLQAVLREGLVELQAHVRARVEPETRPAGALTATFAAHLEFFERQPDLMRILHQVRGALKFGRAPWRPLRTLLRLHVEFLAGLLARGEARAWTPERRRALAALVFGLASGSSSVQASLYPDSTDLCALAQVWATPLAAAALEISARGARAQTARARRARQAR